MDSSKRMTFSEICDQMGWRWRAAFIASAPHLSSQPCMTVPFCVPLDSSLASIRNSARAPRCSRAASDSPAPMIVGVTKSPCRAATCITNRSEEHTSELQSHVNLVCRLLLEKKNKKKKKTVQAKI